MLGCLATASLTTTARAQAKVDDPRPKDVYRIATAEADLNRYAADSFVVKSTSNTASWTTDLMQRYR